MKPNNSILSFLIFIIIPFSLFGESKLFMMYGIKLGQKRSLVTEIYGKPFKNKLQEEFSKYYNICCANANENMPEEFEIPKSNLNINDSFELKRKKEEKNKVEQSEKKEDSSK